MSKLEELIKQYCLDGVEYKKICDIGVFLKGMTGVSKKWEETGNCRFIDYKNVYNNLKIDVSSTPYATVKNCNNQTIIKTGDVLFTSASETPDECAISSVIESELPDNIFLDDHLFGVRFDKNIINATYINYYCRGTEFRKKVNKTVRGVTRYYISMPDFAEIVVPVPPLEVQREIVRVLDSFTFLSAELQARKKQYEYYRDQLLVPSKVEINNCVLSDIATIKNGKDYKHLSEGGYPVYGSGGVMKYVDQYVYDKPSVLIPRKGSLSNLFYLDEPFWNVDTVFYTEINENKVVPKYLYYLLKKEHLENLNKAGGVPSLTQTILNNVRLSIPSLDVQRRIVNCLDSFESICNDLNIGLPAEIEARQKQYEYYRDMLLTFTETGDIMPQTDRQTDKQ